MPKLSEYVRMAADEYVREHGNVEPSARWVADFFHECGVQDEYPRQDLVAFAAMMQKELIKRDEQAAKKALLELEKLDKMIHRLKSAPEILEPWFLRVQGSHFAPVCARESRLESGVQRAS